MISHFVDLLYLIFFDIQFIYSKILKRFECSYAGNYDQFLSSVVLKFVCLEKSSISPMQKCCLQRMQHTICSVLRLSLITRNVRYLIPKFSYQQSQLFFKYLPKNKSLSSLYPTIHQSLRPGVLLNNLKTSSALLLCYIKVILKVIKSLTST